MALDAVGGKQDVVQRHCIQVLLLGVLRHGAGNPTKVLAVLIVVGRLEYFPIRLVAQEDHRLGVLRNFVEVLDGQAL